MIRYKKKSINIKLPIAMLSFFYLWSMVFWNAKELCPLDIWFSEFLLFYTFSRDQCFIHIHSAVYVDPMNIKCEKHKQRDYIHISIDWVVYSFLKNPLKVFVKYDDKTIKIMIFSFNFIEKTPFIDFTLFEELFWWWGKIER